MELTSVERGALYWAKELIERTVEEDETFYDKFDHTNADLKQINATILEKKKKHLSVLEGLLKRLK